MVYEAITSGAFASQPWIMGYIATAFLSGLAFLFMSRVWDDVPLKFPIIHFFIVVWSGTMYFNFLFPSFLSDYAWYADWMVSTPLIVLALGLTALHGADNKRYDLLGALLGAQFLQIVTGIVAQATGSVLPYLVGVGLLGGVVYILWGPMRRIAQDTSDTLGRSYKTLAGYISVFFLLYPAVWFVSGAIPTAENPIGLSALTGTQTSIAFVVLPFFCKQVYGFLDMYLIHGAEQEM